MLRTFPFGLLYGLLIAAAFATTSGCSRSPEARLAAFIQAGKESLERKDYGRALIHLKNAERITPSNAEVQYQLGLAYMGAGDAVRSDLYLRRAARQKHANAQVKLAELQVRFGSNRAALESAERMAEEALKTTGDADALDMAAWAELRLGKAEESEAHLREALGRFPARLQSSVLLAGAKLSRKDFSGAEAVLKSAIQYAGNSAEPRIALAHFYIVTGRPSDAVGEFEAALRLNSNHPQALAEFGSLRLRQGKLEDAEQLYRRLSNLPDKKFKDAHALFLLHVGRTEEALAEFEALYKADPKDSGRHARLVAALVGAGKIAEAEKKLASALAANPNNIEALFQKSAVLVRQGRYGEAEQNLNLVVRKRPDMPEARLALARVCGAQGNVGRQQRELQEALRVSPSLLAARIDLARSMLQTNSPQAALDLLDRAPQFQRASLALRIERNWALLALDRAPEAETHVNAVLAVARTPDVLLQKSILELRAKRTGGAQSVLLEALEHAPEDLRALRLLIATYSNADAAIAAIGKHVERHRHSARLQFFHGELLAAGGRNAQARAALSEALRLNSDFEAARISLARLELVDGNVTTARETITPLLQSSRMPGDALMVIGRVEERTGNLDAALSWYRKAAELDSRNTVALNNTAYLLARKDDQLSEALRFAQLAAERNPDAPAVQDTLGWVYYRMGRFRNALQYFERAGGGPRATLTQKYHLGMAYMRVGRQDAGRQVLTAALKMDPQHPDAAEAQTLLTNPGKAVRNER